MFNFKKNHIIFSLLAVLFSIVANAQQAAPLPLPPPYSQGVPPNAINSGPQPMAGGAPTATPNNPVPVTNAQENSDQLFKDSDYDHFLKQDPAANVFGAQGDNS